MSDQIVTSTGGLGVERRSYDRLYVTVSEPVDEYGPLVDLQDRMSRVMERASFSRWVIRAVVDQSVLEELSEERPEAIETAVPLDTYDSSESWLMTLAGNQAERALTLAPHQDMLRSTQPQTEQNRQPLLALDEGYRVVDGLSSARHNEVFELWGSTFDWTRPQIDVFGANLLMPVEQPSDRALWFSALINPAGRMVSAAMAERLQIPGFNKSLNIVESTEWRTRQLSEDQPRRLLPFVLRSLHRQILRDVPDAVIVAECNYATRADKAGHQSGMVVPDRTFAPQILTQNVAVGDNVKPAGLRDFTLMWLPPC